MKKIPTQKIFLSIVLAVVALTALISVQPAWAYKLQVPFGDNQPSDINGPAQYIHTIYNFGLGFAALLGVLMIVIGGIRYTISEAVPSKEDAKEQITSAIWGLVLLLMAVLILRTINPQIPELKEPEVTKLPPASTGLCGNGKIDAGTSAGLGESCDELSDHISQVCAPKLIITTPGYIPICSDCECKVSVALSNSPPASNENVCDTEKSMCTRYGSVFKNPSSGTIFLCDENCNLIPQNSYTEQSLCDDPTACSTGETAQDVRGVIRDYLECNENCIWHITDMMQTNMK